MTLIKGKVKTVYETDNPEEIIIQYEDKVTAGNGEKEATIKGKGAICCEISRILFKILEKRGIRTHYITMPTESSMCCRRVDIIPIEVVVRNITAGSFVRETTIPEGEVFRRPLVEFYLKDDEKGDPLLTDDRMRAMGYRGDEIDEMEDQAREINSILQEVFFKSCDVAVVDFKLEFGYDCNDNMILADELSPDGMRLWENGSLNYESMRKFDKDLFRKGEGDIVEAYQYILNNLQQFA